MRERERDRKILTLKNNKQRTVIYQREMNTDCCMLS